MTSDVNLFADLFSSVLSQSLKPIVDFVVYSVELSRVQGLATPLTLYGWFAVASMISTVTLPPFGQLAAREQQLDGQFRGTHSELITHCEQIAFLSGEKPEKKQLDAKFMDLYNHCIKTINLSFRSEVETPSRLIFAKSSSPLWCAGGPPVPQQICCDCHRALPRESPRPPRHRPVCGCEEPDQRGDLDLLRLDVEEHGGHLDLDPGPL